MAEQSGAQRVWLPVKAAARRLGVTEQSIRRRINRGTLETRREERGNRVRTLVAVPAEHPAAQSGGHPGAQSGGHGADIQAARLEERLAAAEEIKAELRRQVERAYAELERERLRADEAERVMHEHMARIEAELRRLGELREERRRPWPGLRAWWRRLIEGGG